MLRQIELCLLAILLCALCACSNRESDAKPEFVLTYSVFFPSTHIHSTLANQWAEEVGRRSNGRIRVDVYPGGILSSANENFDCVIMGVSDIGMSCFSYSRGTFPMIEGLDLPWGYRDGSQATKIANEYIRHFQPAELNEVQFLFAHAHGPGLLASRKKVNTFQDFSGMTIRGTGLSAQMIRALGGNPVGMSQGDAYEALRKGVVDATLCPVETLKGWKQGEVINHVTRISAIGYTTAVFVVMNQKTWKRLPADLQQIILDTCLEWEAKHGAAWDQADVDGVQFVTKLGKEFHDFPESENALVKDALTPMFRTWAEKLNAKGLPGNEALQFLQEKLD